MKVKAQEMVSVLLLTITAGSAFSQAPDASALGPFETATGEYRLPAEIDPLVLEGQFTEIWAKTHYPVDSSGPLPTVVFLHGNRATCGIGENPRFDSRCDYTNTGTCPDGYVVVPSHEGFDYVAEPLASWGFAVVSINTNRGISCGSAGPDDLGLNKARGRLVLRHLQRLAEWNVGESDLPGGFPEALRGRLDLSQTGLVGHSRGGEGVRAAHAFYEDAATGWQERIVAPLDVQAIFEIGGVDGQTDTVFDALGTAWTQLLPMCDGDVFLLDGIKPMDRMLADNSEVPPTSKSSFTVWGANHNFFNSEWEFSEVQSCLDHEPIFPPEIGSPEQQQIARAAIMAMMRGRLGEDADRTFLRNFNPAYALPPVISDVTRVDRGYVDAPNRRLEIVLEDFSQPTGTNRYGFDNEYSQVTVEHDLVPGHDAAQKAAEISWSSASADRYVQVNTSAPGTGRDVSRKRTLSFRIARQKDQDDYFNSTDLSIALVNSDGSLSASQPLSDYLDLTGPVGSIFGRNTIMQTVRIPLANFAGADLTTFRGVRFTFDIPNPGASSDDGGAIFLSNIHLPTRLDRNASQPISPTPSRQIVQRAEPAVTLSGHLAAVRSVARSTQLGGAPAVEIALETDAAFPVTDALPTLAVGGLVSRHARYSADARRLTFTFPAEAFRAIGGSSQVELRLGAIASLALGPVGTVDDSAP